MKEQEFIDLLKAERPAIDQAAKDQAISSAMAAFDEANASPALKRNNRNLFQGLMTWLRLKGSHPLNGEKRAMKKLTPTWYLGGAGSAVAMVTAYLLLSPQEFYRPMPDVPLVIIDSEVAEKKLRAEPELAAAPVEYEEVVVTGISQSLKEFKLEASGAADASDGQAYRDLFGKLSAEPRMKARLEERAASELRVAVLPARLALEPVAMPDNRNNRDQFKKTEQNTVKKVTEEPVSTFSIDVDTASYSFVRRSLNSGRLPAKEAVRTEEMLNYFDYSYLLPESKTAPFATTVALTQAPWSSGKQHKTLLHIGIKGYELAGEKPKSNLVFLLDVSGSMNSPDKLPLVIQSFELLLSQLNAEDKVSIVVYAGAAGTVLEPTAVKEKGKILDALNQLSAGGSTAGAQGIERAYELAERNFDKNAVNRIVLATDGDFNVGISDPDALKTYVERKRDKGIYLSVLGFGQGNYNDHLMQELAQNGNGIAAYIDTLSEAQKVLVNEATSSLFPIAQDVKIQLEFNPSQVSEYRLLGYETRALNREDFNNDKVDAGDIGAGHTVTAIYELVLASSDSQQIDALRYSKEPVKENRSSEFGFLKLRYKLPGETESRLIEQPITQHAYDISKNLKQEVNFATAVAGFAELLKGGQYQGDWGYQQAIDLAQTNKGEDLYGYRTEFVQLVRKAKIAKEM